MIKSVRFRFDKIYAETDRAILVLHNGGEVWLPKRLCRNFTHNQKLSGSVSIPKFLYERITGKIATIDQADHIITKHTPERIKPIKTTPDASLAR